MDLFGALARWLDVSEEPVSAGAIIVLDGGEHGNRMVKGIELLGAGFAPWLLASHSLPYRGTDRTESRRAAQAQASRVLWINHESISTRGEAVETLKQAKRFGCSKVLVVTSSYHTRRTRKIFARLFRPAGIDVRTIAAPVPNAGETPWWQTRWGRSMILFELTKLTQTGLHINLPFSMSRHLRLAHQVQQILYRIS